MNFEILTDLIMIMLQRKFPIGVKRNMDYTRICNRETFIHEIYNTALASRLFP